MDFQDRLVLVKKEVEGELAVFFVKKQQEAKRISSHCVTLVDAIRDLTLRGGKRTRAFLCWLGYEAAKIKDQKSKIKNTEEKSKIATSRLLIHAMMGVELFQSFALIHDDIIDEDTTRRGGPAVHEAFRISASTHLPIHPSTHSPITTLSAQRFGESMAILAGDLALVWADELIGSVVCQASSVTPEKKINFINGFTIYQKMKQEVILGQGLDVLASVGLPSADQATINQYKTAWYSVIRPLQIGASLGGAHTDAIEAFVPYGLAVGEAYQLRDDFLDGEVGEDAFRTQAKKLENQTVQATQAIHASVSIGSLLADFARFALSREA